MGYGGNSVRRAEKAGHEEKSNIGTIREGRGFSRNLPNSSSEPIINDLACKLCVSNDRSGMQLSISPNPVGIIYIFTDIPKRFRCAFRFLEAVACEWSSKSSHCRSLLHINRFSSVQIISNLSHISISSYYVHSHFI